MTDPSTTDLALDPVTWLVWADWLEEHGDGTAGTRARNIARGLEKTKGLLFLFVRGQGIWHQSVFNASSYDDEELNEMPYSDCEWRTEGNPRYTKSDFSHSPVNKPVVYQNAPRAVKAYWDKLAELGSSSL